MGIVFENNEYALISESAFHTKLYKITGNKIISEFQEIILMGFTLSPQKNLFYWNIVQMWRMSKITIGFQPVK